MRWCNPTDWRPWEKRGQRRKPAEWQHRLSASCPLGSEDHCKWPLPGVSAQARRLSPLILSQINPSSCKLLPSGKESNTGIWVFSNLLFPVSPKNAVTEQKSLEWPLCLPVLKSTGDEYVSFWSQFCLCSMNVDWKISNVAWIETKEISPLVSELLWSIAKWRFQKGFIFFSLMLCA